MSLETGFSSNTLAAVEPLASPGSERVNIFVLTHPKYEGVAVTLVPALKLNQSSGGMAGLER